MGALSLTSFSVAAPKKFLQFSNNDDLWLLMTKKKSTVAAHCQSGGGGGNERRYGGLPSILTKRLSATVASNGHGRGGGALMETRSLVLSKNGGPTTVEVDEEIGIVKFLSRKSFFITGATGFLAKGTFPLQSFLLSEETFGI
ncbi:alcohol-forming fatty acyl-CoA reductase [Sarracenia purpurea var. burkii]